MSNFAVRLILAVVGVAVLITVAVVSVGAVSVRTSDNEVHITIDRGQLREEAQQEVQNLEESGRKVLDRTAEALRSTGEKIRGKQDAGEPQTGGEASAPEGQEGLKTQPPREP